MIPFFLSFLEGIVNGGNVLLGGLMSYVRPLFGTGEGKGTGEEGRWKQFYVYIKNKCVDKPKARRRRRRRRKKKDWVPFHPVCFHLDQLPSLAR